MTGPQAFIWATRRDDLVLLTGKGLMPVLRDAGIEATWSESGKGWCVSLMQAFDLQAYCWATDVIYRERVAT